METNITLIVPEVSTNHGDPELLCTPAKWTDYLVFFFSNYVAHAVTTVAVPGQGLEATVFSFLYAIVCPASAIYRALNAITRHAATARKNPLTRAARAGALCMVSKVRSGTFLARHRRGERNRLEEVRSESLSSPPRRSNHWWEPTEFRNAVPVPSGSQIHGEYRLHKDYYLAVVPHTASLELAFDEQTAQGGADCISTGYAVHSQKPLLASSNNFMKLVISFVQTCWASVTVYQTRGDQIQQYGYAAFGLTVVPYAFMSALNTLANLATPEYPAMFLIRTPTLVEAERTGRGYFKGALHVKLKASPAPRSLAKSTKEWVPISVLSFLFSLVPLGVVAALSHGFGPGDKSTAMDRGFTLAWLVLGIVLGSTLGGVLFSMAK
ncbi:hypothetical protein QBC35DRAFT_395605 [Podospora australis]|uniref:Uncharacterized protein n=1 Tax=Podospora australis TaxID=1536484 RepID=A0AAN7ACZ0_9PEZI|nr:hypothetical protein QBC35DRAFT_395605 [Podospora australis]